MDQEEPNSPENENDNPEIIDENKQKSNKKLQWHLK